MDRSLPGLKSLRKSVYKAEETIRDRKSWYEKIAVAEGWSGEDEKKLMCEHANC